MAFSNENAVAFICICLCICHVNPVVQTEYGPAVDIGNKYGSIGT